MDVRDERFQRSWRDDAASITSGAVRHVSLKMLFRLGNADSDGV
jgi:hypothetical protein